MVNVIRAYTRWAAYASFDDQRKGTLAPGMLADIAVLTRDVFGRPTQGPDDIKAATAFDGGWCTPSRSRLVGLCPGAFSS